MSLAIELQVDAVRIIAALIWFGNDEKLIWTKNIMSRVTSCSSERVTSALSWLSGKDMIATHKGEYTVTGSGAAYYNEARVNPHSVVKAADVWKFKNELLTGMYEKRSRVTKQMISEQSPITRGVLPTTKPEKETHITPEEMLSGYEGRTRKIKRIASDLKITVEQFSDYWDADKIRICSAGGESHLGVFDVGKPVCRRCTKKRGRK